MAVIVEESIAARLQKAMSLRDMKQHDLVEKTKISKGSISQYVTGYVEPKSDRIYMLAKALDVNPVWLMGFRVPMEVDAVHQLSASSAEMILELKKDPEAFRFYKSFVKLTPEQKVSVINLVESMVPKDESNQNYVEIEPLSPNNSVVRTAAYQAQLSMHPEQGHEGSL